MDPDPSAGGLPGTRPSGRDGLAILGKVLFAIGCLLALAMLAGYRAFSWDEFEFVRATEFVRQGLVPYRDFWEHHTPLQWFLMAPLKTFFQGPGSATLVAMRATQIPVWVALFWLLNRLVVRSGASKASRWVALACLLLSPIFLLYAVEYRQETLSSFFIVSGLWLLETPGQSPWRLRWAGAILALAPLANMRFGPWVVAALALQACADPEAARWRWRTARALSLVSGAGAVALAGALYLVLSGSMHAFWAACVQQNALGDQIIRSNPLAPPTSYLATFWTLINRLDLGALAMLAAGLAQLGAWCRRPARCTLPDRMALLLFLQLTIMAKASGHFNYHVQLPIILATPVLAHGLDLATRRFGPRARRAAGGLLVLGLVLDYGFLYQWRSQRQTALYMDQVMRESVRVTQPGEKVWDGVGYCLARPPYFKYWFLPFHLRLLALAGKAEGLPVPALAKDPPGAIVFGGRILAWVNLNPPMQAYFQSHFLPGLMHVWVPGLSATLDAANPESTWLVPRTGDYWLAASPELADHPWFRGGDALTMFAGDPARVPRVTRTARPAVPQGLALTCRGRLLVLEDGCVHLDKGSLVTARYDGSSRLGLFLVTERVEAIFTRTLGIGESFDAEVNVMAFGDLL